MLFVLFSAILLLAALPLFIKPLNAWTYDVLTDNRASIVALLGLYAVYLFPLLVFGGAGLIPVHGNEPPLSVFPMLRNCVETFESLSHWLPVACAVCVPLFAVLKWWMNQHELRKESR